MIDDELVTCFLRLGLSPQSSLGLASAFGPRLSRELERERRDKAIRELWPVIGLAQVIERLGVTRSTAYRALHKIPKNAHLWNGRRVA